MWLKQLPPPNKTKRRVLCCHILLAVLTNHIRCSCPHSSFLPVVRVYPIVSYSKHIHFTYQIRRSAWCKTSRTVFEVWGWQVVAVKLLKISDMSNFDETRWHEDCLRGCGSCTPCLNWDNNVQESQVMRKK